MGKKLEEKKLAVISNYFSSLNDEFKSPTLSSIEHEPPIL